MENNINFMKSAIEKYKARKDKLPLLKISMEQYANLSDELSAEKGWLTYPIMIDDVKVL
jgi:acyl carrier protein phosphodiesterase